MKLLPPTDDDGGAAIRDVVAGALVDGVMLMEVQQRDPRVALLASLKCPAVIVGTPDDTAKGRTAELGPNYPKYSEALWTAVQAVLSGKSTPQAALNEAQAKAAG